MKPHRYNRSTNLLNIALSPPPYIWLTLCSVIFLILCCPITTTPGPSLSAPTATPWPTIPTPAPTNTPIPPSTDTPAPVPTDTPVPTPTDTPPPAPPSAVPTDTPPPPPTDTPQVLATDTPPPAPEPITECPYIGNTNTMKFHHAGCASVGQMKPEHKKCFPSREEAIANGYQPCGRCNP